MTRNCILPLLGLFAIPLACSSSDPPRDSGMVDAPAVGAGGGAASGGAAGGIAATGGSAEGGAAGGNTGPGGTAGVGLGGTGGAGGGADVLGGAGGTAAAGGASTFGAGGSAGSDARSRDSGDGASEVDKDAPPTDVPGGPTDTVVADSRPSDAGAALPTKSAVLEAMRRANDFFLARWPDPTVDIVTDKTRPSNLWTRAIYFEGLMALYAVETDATRKAALYDYAVRWGESPSHPWTLTYTSAGSMTSNADNQACGQTYIDLYQIDPKPERIATIKANIDDMVARKTDDAWTWIDAIQMSMPVFARLGVVYSSTGYFDAMWTLYNNARTQQGGGLRSSDGLWWRDLHFTPGGGTSVRMTSALHGSMPGSSSDASILSPNGKDLFWSRGNGWVLAALVRVLDLLPASDSHRATYVSDLQSLAAALLPIQRSDGFWNESLLDPSHCKSIGLDGQDGPETSGTALFAYGLGWGIRQGLLDGGSYAPALANAWRGLVGIALQSDGRIGYVQSTGDRPCTDTAALGPTKLANFDDYGVGAFLLAGSEVYRLAE